MSRKKINERMRWMDGWMFLICIKVIFYVFAMFFPHVFLEGGGGCFCFVCLFFAMMNNYDYFSRNVGSPEKGFFKLLG